MFIPTYTFINFCQRGTAHVNYFYYWDLKKINVFLGDDKGC